ncbi:MAG: hypothetical protein ABSB66_09745 [Candidatus Acidiferrales bacterium]|jgi:hypothetical protein
MKTAALFVLLLVATLATLARAAPAPDEYSITVHVTSSCFVGGGQRLDVVINSKKYQLSGFSGATKYASLLALGDYKAKLVKDQHETAYDSYQEYEFLLPDKKTRKFLLSGQSE